MITWRNPLQLPNKAKVKVKSLYLTKHHAMKTYWEMDVQFHAFYDLGIRQR